MSRSIILTELIFSCNLIIFIILYPVLIVIAVIQKIVKLIRNTINCKKTIAGQVALITGSGRGLGRAIAIELARRGCHVAIVDIQEKLADETAKYIAEQFNVKTRAYKIDVTDYHQLVELRNKVTEDLGHTTILINNAGILLLSSIESPTPQEIQQMINVNITSIVFANQIFLPKMKELNMGHIVTISSMMALFPFYYGNIYGTTKSAVRSLTSALRTELMAGNITATTVMPWFLHTNERVEKLMKIGGLPITMPLIEGDTAAKYVVNAMINGVDEISIPYSFLYTYKLLELLPAFMKDKASFIFGQVFVKSTISSVEAKNILSTSDIS